MAGMYLHGPVGQEVSFVRSLYFAVTFPPSRVHATYATLRSLAQRQLSDVEIIETADHLMKCARCMTNYRLIRNSLL